MNAETRKKIVWLHSHFLLNTGGTRFVYEVASRLKQHYEITVIVERTNSDWKNKFNNQGITIHELSPVSSDSLLYWLTFPFWLLRARRKLRTLVTDTNLTIASMFPLNWLATYLGNIPSIQICFEPYAFFYDKVFINSFAWPKRLCIKILAFLYQAVDKAGVRRSTTLLALNAGVANWVKEIYQRPADGITKIGVDTDLFQYVKNAELKNRYQDQAVIMHSTDFTAIKGTQYLVRMLPTIVQRVPNLKVLITESVSDPKKKAALQALARQLKVEQYLNFLGSVPYSQLPAYYSLADVYTFTGDPASKGASLASLSVLEALACGTPVVRSSGTKDEVIDGKSGFVVDPRNTTAFANAVSTILLDPKKATTMGRVGQQYVLNTYTWDAVVHNIIKTIDHLI